MDKQSIKFKIHDDILQKSCSITVNVGDKYRDYKGWVWKCTSIGYQHVTFTQDVIIEYDWHIPMSQRVNPYYIMTFEETKRVLQCPIYNWTKTNEATRTIKY